MNLEEVVGAAVSRFKAQRDDDSVAQLRDLRLQLVQFLIVLKPEEANATLSSGLLPAVKLLHDSGLRLVKRTPEEDVAFASALERSLVVDPSLAFRGPALAALLLCWHPLELGLLPSLPDAPTEVRAFWWDAVLRMPECFQRPGEADRYVDFLDRVLSDLEVCVSRKSDPLALQALHTFLGRPIFLQAYFNVTNLKSLMVRRSRLLESILGNASFTLDEAIDPRPVEGRRYRIGFVSGGLDSFTETTFELAHLEHLRDDRIDARLYAFSSPRLAIGQRCLAVCPELTILPGNVASAARRIRQDQLDAVVICSNVSASQHGITMLAAHRLAPVQIANMASPVTTGLRNVDYMISGRYNEPDASAEHWTETLALLPGALNCYPFQYDRSPCTVTFERASLGIGEDEVVFFSAANYFKILPELSDVWAEILAAVPGSRLIALPFNQNWSNSYEDRSFVERFNEQLRSRGVEIDRLKLLNPVPSQADLHHLMGQANVYLDAYPFSGACSLVDPLEVGLPVVVWAGPTTRSRHALAMLRAANLEDMVSYDRASYVARAVALGLDAKLRQTARARIEAAHARMFPFMDTRPYGEALSDLLLEILDKADLEARELRVRPPVELRALAVDIVRDALEHTSVPLKVTDDDLITQLVAPFFRRLTREAMTRRVVDVGAAYGTMSAPLLAEGWRATLFEPDPRCHAGIVKNLKEYETHYELVTSAVGNTSSDAVSFNQADLPGLSGLDPSPYSQGDRVLRVPCVTLTEFLTGRGIRTVDFLKIDAEGRDFEALESLDLKRWRPRVIMTEYNTAFDGTGIAAVNRTAAIMAAQGYDCVGFLCHDDGQFKQRIWTYRLVGLSFGPQLLTEDAPPLGNLLFFQQGDPEFLSALVSFARMLARR